jgi:predicted RNase H-like nuclease
VVAESRLATDNRAQLAAPRFWIAPTFGDLLAALDGKPAVVGLDIPIGLPAGRPWDDGIRAADRAARAFLGGRRGSSVFAAPCRRTLAADSYAAACASELDARGVMLSRQAFGILPKIGEVDRAIRPAHQLPPEHAAGPVVREVHPEVAFALLAGAGAPGQGLLTGKRTPAGEAERLALLQPLLGELDIGAIRAGLMAPPARTTGSGWARSVGRDDIVDALVCLVVAQRIATGQARTFPDGPPRYDERGLRMEIVA